MPTVATTMKALLEKAPRDISAFEVESISTPTISSNQVLIEVYAASLNAIDKKRSHFGVPDTYPYVVGYDVAGVVKKVGESVTRWKEGDAVFGDVMRTSIGPKVTGTIAEFCACDEDLLARIPEGVSFREAAAVPLVVMAAMQALDIVGLKEGDNILITGGSSGVGLHAIQLAKKVYKAGQIATTASTAKIELMKQCGADIVVDYKKDNAAEKLPKWADVVFDITAESEMEKKVLKDGGKLVTITEVHTPGLTFIDMSPSAERMEKVASLLKEKTISVVVDTVYQLEDAKKAFQQLADGHSKGKIIVEIKS